MTSLRVCKNSKVWDQKLIRSLNVQLVFTPSEYSGLFKFHIWKHEESMNKSTCNVSGLAESFRLVEFRPLCSAVTREIIIFN